MKLLKSKNLRRLLWGIGGLIISLLVFGLLQLIEPVAIAPIAQSSQPQFAGRALLVASDADMVATAYADGVLEQVPGIQDTLSVVNLPLNPDNPVVAQVPVSNSVQSWPQIIATSPDGTKAYVVEVRGQAPDNVQQYESVDTGMPKGSLVTVVDISNPTQPTVVETVPVGQNPNHVSISPDGRLLAIALYESGKELLIASLQPDGRIGKRFYFPATNLVGRAALVESVSWHPSGSVLAVALDNREVAFYDVQGNPTDNIRLTPHGQSIQVGNWLSLGRFTPDGRYYLIPDLKWRTRGQRLLDFLANPKGELIAIRFEDSPNTQPAIASKAEVGLSPEGFALSPDGTLIATVNMRRTYLPSWLPAWRGRDRSSVSLVTLDSKSGQLTTVEEYGFEGLLPEDAVFDADGKSLAIVIYNYRVPNPKTGEVQFWNVIRDPKPRLERTRFKLEVVRGPHTIALIK